MLILSLDGGGVRGMLTASLILRLDQELPGWTTKVDLFAGASTGALIALALAKGITPFDVFEFYRDKLPDVFHRPWWRRFSMLWRAKYSNAVLKGYLDDTFEGRTLGSLAKDVLIGTYFLGSQQPFSPARARFYDRSDVDLKIADVALWSSSAPTYFPSADRHVDGGLAANNCVVCAIAFLEGKGCPLSEIKVISIGTGSCPVVIDGGDVGITYWGTKLLTPFVDGGVDVADFQARHLLGGEGNYHRLQLVVPEEIPLDDVSRLDDLIAWGNAANIEPTVNWLAEQFSSTTS